jgi:hypothetical protein
MRRVNNVHTWVPLLLGILATYGCVGDGITALKAPALAATSLAFVNGSPTASIVAIGGTQQLSATGTTFTGAAITMDSVIYQLNTLSDSVRLRLANTGLVTALASTNRSPVRINVLGFKDGVVRGDQIVVQVTLAAPAGLVFSIKPIAPDSAKLASGTTKTINPVLMNPNTGESVSTPAVMYKIKGSDSARVDTFRGVVTYRITNTDIMTVRTPQSPSAQQPNQITALRGEGTAWIYAAINAYGTAFADSVQYTFSYPYTQTIGTGKANLAIQSMYADQTVTLAPGATVTFQNTVPTTDPLTIAYTFDNPGGATAASPASTTGGASGNVTALAGGQSSRRQFLTPGTYKWTTTAAGGPAPWPGQTQSGTIVIK